MSTTRRDTLVAIEKVAQAYWEKNRLHEVDAPQPGEARPPKYLTTFPFPYMNGRLHLGHGFSLTKSEFISRYQRMKGCRSLWPFGFHVTGTPIAACAQKIAKEIEMYGNPPVFPDSSEETAKSPSSPSELTDLLKFKSKRGKVGPAKPQWAIMQSMGIPDSEIPKFANPQQWLDYFPPIAIQDLRQFGCHIDFRRSFITTTQNPYFDRFVSWQFRKLRKAGLLNFGKRYCIYSPLDGQPCADHDRASGEGALPQEYTVVKLTVQDLLTHPTFKPFAGIIGDRRVVLPAATLRAETIVGQTNCWVSPDITYRAYAVLNDRTNVEEIFVMTARSARNMAYQDFTINGRKWAEPSPLFEVSGASLIGLPLAAPLAPYPTIFTLPMSTIMEGKGTGVVLSEPSDSPDDHINLRQLRDKPEYRKKLGIRDEWVLPFLPVPIIEVPELGTNCAEVMCERLRVNGPNATEPLEEAKRVCYQLGFYQGVMVAGPFTGERVADAKLKTQRWLEENGEGVRYCEPVRPVTSRSGDDCVVALGDQWYIEYGQPNWREVVQKHLESMNLFCQGVRNGFVEVLNWLSDWPCSRTFGLGTYLPCEESHSMIIDSLSDSTIYMAYYTISRFLHVTKDGTLVLDGVAGESNPYGLKPEMFTDEIFDHIFHGAGDAATVAATVGMPIASLELMRNEFEYFYPVDIRCSAKDLIQNHLTMFLYNHAAIWPDDQSKWPRAIFCNGHIQVDNEKMAKSKGNFISLGEAIETYGADATRLACADAGDTLEDANFVRDTAASFVLKLTTLLEQAKEQLAREDMRTGPHNVFDKIFNNTLNTITTATDGYYESMQFRMVLNTAFHELTNEFSQYKLNCGDVMVHGGLVQRYYELLTLLLMPLAPHFCEHMWQNVLKKEGTVVVQAFPKPDAPLDYPLIVMNRVMMEVVKEIRAQVAKCTKQKKVVETVVIYTLVEYAEWQVGALKRLQAIYQENSNTFPADIAKQIISSSSEWLPKNLIPDTMAFISFVRTNVEKYGLQAMSLEPVVNDFELLSSVNDNISKLSGVSNILVKYATDESFSGHAAARRKCRAGEPTVAFIFAK
ncbi:unnamed protein product [Phytomonas sp. EM1]|nr:unnamed protein product [Phytomonas sp. EM1]|eukprot:CCW61838.1 unnamed protein product [Phytomonas sp. isolate EM1]